MTDLEWVESRIECHEKNLREAEAEYHRAVTYSELSDMRAKLTECQAIRAKLLEYIARRDELEGGAQNAENQD